MESFVDALKTTLGRLLLTEPSGTKFFILLGVAGFGLVLFGKLFAGYAVKSERGVLPVFGGVLLGLLFAVVGASAADLYLVEKVDGAPMKIAVLWAGGLVPLLAVGVYLGKLLFDVSWFQSLVVQALTYAVSFGLVILGGIVVDTFVSGSESIENIQEKRGF